MWHIGSAMMDNGMNFTDFDDPMDSPVSLILGMDDLIMEPLSRMVKSASEELGMDLDKVFGGLLNSFDINQMPPKMVIEAVTDQLSKIVGNEAMAEFYHNHLDNFEETWHQLENIAEDAEENSYAVQEAIWAMNYTNADGESWEDAFHNIGVAVMTNNLNRQSVTQFISFFRQFMIDFFENTDYEAQMQDGLVWLEPIFLSNDWENIDTLLSAPQFVEPVMKLGEMIWSLEHGMNWFEMPEQNNGTMAQRRKRREVHQMMDIDDIMNTISGFLPAEAQHFVAAIQQSPFMSIVGHVMSLNETEVELAIGNVIQSAVMAIMDVNMFEVPIENYEEANQALMESAEMQQLIQYFMSIPEHVDGQLIPFKLQDMMNAIWNFINADEIVAVSEAQEYFALYWFQQVSAQKHVDVIYAISDLVEAVTGLGINDIPMFAMDVESWINSMMGMRKRRSAANEMPMTMPWGCACNPMDRAFTWEGKMEVNSPDSPGSPETPSSPMPSEPCMVPVTQNREVFNHDDGTVRPYNNPRMCAVTKNLRNKQAVRWMNCEAAREAGYKMQFTYHAELVNMPAPIQFDEFELYPSVMPGENWLPVGTIRSTENEDRCWTIANGNRATSKASPIFLKNCDPERFAGRQMWSVISGNILLMSDDHTVPAMSSNWRSFVGVPFLGEGQKLKTRRIFDIAMGGNQLMADGVTEVNMEPEAPEAHHEMPACVLLFETQDMVEQTIQMINSPGHDAYTDCVVMTHEQAAMAMAGP